MTTTGLFDEEGTPPHVEAPAPEVPVQRVFRYAEHTIPDPGPHLSVEDVRRALVTYFPDLVQATTTTTTEGDTQVITFTKQTTRKGAADLFPPSVSVIEDLATHLLALTPIADPLETLDLPEPLTLRAIADNREDIRAALAHRAHHAHACERIWKRCFTLPATPLHTRLPLGF